MRSARPRHSNQVTIHNQVLIKNEVAAFI